MRRLACVWWAVGALAACEAPEDDAPSPAASTGPVPALSAPGAVGTLALVRRPPSPPTVHASAADACPPDVVCVPALPFTHRATTSVGRDAFDRYACAPEADESGPEVVFRLDVIEAGLLALEVGEMPLGVDVDVHLLDALDPDACLDRGHWRAAAWVEPGRYWAVADTWVDEAGVEQAGGFTLTAALTTPATLAAAGMDSAVAERGLRAFAVAWAHGDTDRFEYALTDFSLHSAEPRQWIVDLAVAAVLWNLHVAHGRGMEEPEDVPYAPAFSNVPETHLSSLGMMRSAEPYVGDYGPSFRLDGLEPGFNDNVRTRDIVMHPWEGSRPEYVGAHGFTQPTWGCPAIDDRIAPQVVLALSGGALMWFWYPDAAWGAGSAYSPE